MPLNRPALSLGPGPRGVQDARRWVVDTCHDIGRDDLVECAELGVSELVTNALLHGDPADHGPGPRHPGAPPGRGPRRLARAAASCPAATTLGDDDDLLLTFGRGPEHRRPLLRRAWGAEIEDDGKVVWFDPATEPSEETGRRA